MGAFEHTPLDRTIQSLRIVHILPNLSSDGRIQCSIRHANTTSRYVCLSYRWGEDDAEHEQSILMDGKLFPIRRNLLDFLHIMQSTAPREDPIFDPEIGYWIDALCIDQLNLLERNHQVAQMGSIFSKADYVHVWLGKTPGAERIRRLVEGPGESMSLGTWSSFVRQDMAFLEEHVFKNEYWTRAWVVQEIVLAKLVEVSLDTERFPFTQLIQNIRSFCLNWAGTHFEQFAFDGEGTVKFRNKSLLTLLDRFQEKGCSLVHDRVFSLLALCNDGADVVVNYDLSRSLLAYLTLRAHQEKLCICSARVVASNLGLGQIDPLATTRESRLRIELVDVKLLIETTGSITLVHSDFQDGQGNWKLESSPGPDPFKGWWPGCVGHWVSHLAATLYSHLDLSMIKAHHGNAKRLTLPLADILGDTSYLKQEQISCPPNWTRLSPETLIQIRGENICVVSVSLSTLLTECSYLPRLCSIGNIWEPDCPRSVALGIHVALA